MTAIPDPADVEVKLSQSELSTLLSALYDKRVETQGYLRGWPRSVAGHDDCCPTSIARMAVLDDQRRALEAQSRREDELIMRLELHVPKQPPQPD